MTEGVAIILPTHLRADVLPGLVENIADTTGGCRVYFVAETHDEPTVNALVCLVDTPGVVAVIGRFGSCAAAMNAGYQAVCEDDWGEFVFTANDDLRFHKGWDLEARKALDEPGKHICGTNDGNGRMTCFAMARRQFIMNHSGVYDQPNTLYHPYISQYPDTELADYAKHRGVWTEAPNSLTEHMHWEFGKADRDHPNYVKAQSTCGVDAATYQQRRTQWERLPAS